MEKLTMDEIITAIVEGGDIEKAAEEVLALPPLQQEEILQRLGGIKKESAGRFLSLLYPRLSDKGLRKLVKKSLFHLKTLGITVEEPKAAGESVLRQPVEIFRDSMGLMSNYDAASTRVVLAAVEVKKNHFLFSHAIIHFTDGLLRLMSMTVVRKSNMMIGTVFGERPVSPKRNLSSGPAWSRSAGATRKRAPIWEPVRCV